MVRWVAARVLRGQQRTQLEVVGIAHRFAEVGVDPRLDRPKAFAHAHLGSFARYLDRITFLTAVTIVKRRHGVKRRRGSGPGCEISSAAREGHRAREIAQRITPTHADN